MATNIVKSRKSPIARIWRASTTTLKVLTRRQLSISRMKGFKNKAKIRGKRIETTSNGNAAYETRGILSVQLRDAQGFKFGKAFRVRKGVASQGNSAAHVQITPIHSREYDQMGRLVRKIKYTKKGPIVTEYNPPGRFIGKRVR